MRFTARDSAPAGAMSLLLPLALLAPLAAPAPTLAEAEKPASFALPRDEAQRLGAVPADGEAQRFVPGKGIEFKSKDGRFSLAMSLRFGFLYSMRRDADPPDILHNFEIRR